MKVKRTPSIIQVPHLEGNIKIQHPFFHGDYFGLAKQIDENGLKRPTMAEVVSLVYDAYKNPDDDKAISNEIKEIELLYSFEGLLNSSEGVFIQDNPDFKKNAKHSNHLIMDEKDLKLRLGSREENGVIYGDDELTRFVPNGFETKQLTSKEVVNHSFIIGLIGKEGAEKLSYIIDHNENKSIDLMIYETKDDIKRVPVFQLTPSIRFYGIGACVDELESFGIIKKLWEYH